MSRRGSVGAVAVAALLGVFAVAARGGDEGKPLERLVGEAKSAYDKSRQLLGQFGVQAKKAAEAGDYAAWQPANYAYVEALEGCQSTCETNVRVLSSEPNNLADHGFKKVFAALTPYLDSAPTFLRSRLHLQAYGNLLSRASPADRKAALAALATVYFTGE